LRTYNLEGAAAKLDFLLVRHVQDVGVTILRREGDVQVLVAR
jgi:hypothetical protein